MLLLVGTDRHVIGVIQQNVRRHQAWVSEQPRVYVIGVLCGFILKLRHAGELAELGVATQYPCKLCVLRNLTLDEENALFRVDAEREHHRVGGKRVFAEFRRVLAHGDGVQVGKRVHAFIVVLQRDEVLQRAEVVAEREHARRLNHAQNALLFCFGCGVYGIFHGDFPL